MVCQCSVEEYRGADTPEQEIFGDNSEVWERCTVQALFAASTDVDATLAQWHTQSGSAAPLKYEAGGSSARAVLAACLAACLIPSIMQLLLRSKHHPCLIICASLHGLKAQSHTRTGRHVGQYKKCTVALVTYPKQYRWPNKV